MQAQPRVHPVIEWMVAHNLLIEELEAQLNPNPPIANEEEQHALVASDGQLSRLGELLNRLPFEILGEVFDWVGRVDEPSLKVRRLFPLRLSQVSSRWRKVCTRTPRLWTHVRVTVRGRVLGPTLQLIRHWLERCGSCKILIEVDFKEANGTEPAYLDDVLGLFRKIAKEAAVHRRDFDMLQDGAIFETKLRATSLGVIPVIEERYVWYGGVQDVPDEENELVAPFQISGLRLAVDTFGLEYHAPLSSSLTSVDLQDGSELYCLSCMELLIILAEFPVLKRCAAYINNGNALHSERVLASNLEYFSLSWHYTVDVGPFLDQLTTPALKDLELMGDIPSGGRWDHLYHFITRSVPPVRSLTFVHMDGFASRIGECIAVCNNPTLQALWLENCLLDDEFIQSLGEKPKQKGSLSVLDRLQRLGLVCIEGITGKRLVGTLNLKATNGAEGVEPSSGDSELFVYDCRGVSEADFAAGLDKRRWKKVEFIDTAFCEGVDVDVDVDVDMDVESSDDDSSER